MDRSRGTPHGVRFVVPSVLVVAAVNGLVFAVSSCGTREIVFTYVNHDTDAGADACTCVDWPVQWQDPVWLALFPDDAYLGSGEGVPSCEDFGRDEAYHGHEGLVAPLACGPCVCQTPTGSCELPSAMTAHDVACQDVGLPHKDTSFDAPPAWDGGCDDTNPVGAGAGAKSLSVAPLVVKDSCQVGPKIPENAIYPVPPYWHKYGLACLGQHMKGGCGNGYSTCVPDDDAPSPEFKLCILRLEDVPDECPAAWPEKHVLYGDTIHDHRGCTDCTCGPPQGSLCTSMLSVYKNTDTTCSGPVVFGQHPISSMSPGPCFDQSPSGQPMGSKSALPPTYIPGKCEPMGGDSFIDGDGGVADPTEPVTFCCKR